MTSKDIEDRENHRVEIPEFIATAKHAKRINKEC